MYRPLLILAGLVALAGAPLYADSKQPAAKKQTAPALPASPISPEQWRRASTAPLQAGEIDRLVTQELARAKIQPAPLTTDEHFVRRVTLDLTGRLPVPADVTEFLADRDPAKRAKLIDRLLESDEYASHWAHYWRDVIASRLTDQRGLLIVRHFDLWLTEQIKKNAGWDAIARAMITASGDIRQDQPGQNGAGFFLASHIGADATNERAAETSRVFLGIQIQCAQCHDHPFDDWKRVQFHELAAYFSRLKERPLRDGNRIAGLTLFSLPFGEQQMPGTEDPKKTTTVNPRFLNGESPGNRLGDVQRRRSLADAITSRENPWFAAAYVNRIWGELMGQSFCQPVDDLGPRREVILPAVLVRLSGAFRGSDHDTKALFRAIMNSQVYQRQIRLGESADEHLLFAAVYPTRLNGDALWHSLVGVLGEIGGQGGFNPRAGQGPFAFRQGFEFLFQQEFNYDPSTKPEEVEGSIPQALLMMNSPVINQRIQARGSNLLARILTAYPDNKEAVRMVYLRTLARRPTDRELGRCLGYISRVGGRAEAFEDILWSLLNSTEFQTKR